MDSTPCDHWNDFMSAIRQGDSNTVRNLLKVCPLLVNMNAESPELTPLYVAVRKGHADIVKILIKHGANVYLLIRHDRTLIDVAVRRCGKKRGEICKILIEAGVDVNQRDMFGSPPIYKAIGNENEDVAILLLELGADVNSKLEDGTVVLHSAAELGLKRLCELLVDSGADVNAKDGLGMTPLHMAAEMGFTCVVQILLNAGADIDATNVDGNTALHGACIFDAEPVVLTLIENGADVNVVNNEGERAFDIEVYEEWTTYQLDLLKMQIATNEGEVEDLGIATDRSWQVELMSNCEEEVERMRSSTINNTNVTFHDILTKSLDQVAFYLRNVDVVQALRLEDYKKEFPVYAHLIEGRFRRSIARKELLDEGHQFFLDRFSEYRDLVYKYSDEILSYLSNRDLTNLKGAWLPDNNDVTKEETL